MKNQFLRQDTSPAPKEESLFKQQTDFIDTSSAQYDGESKTWYYWLTGDSEIDAPTLDILFRAAKEHGTHIRTRIGIETN